MVAILDFVSGYELTLSVFYSIPIALVTWLNGRKHGIAASIISALIWLFSRIATGRFASLPVLYVWNALIEFSSLIVIVILLSEISQILASANELAHIDYLTGAINSRYFYEILQMEIRRSNRYKHPFSIAYFDIDNFKTINDQLGHGIGDEVLQAVVFNAKRHLRKTDAVARLGGDEFAILLPETDKVSAQVALSKIHNDISEGMQENNWLVTLSIGVLTCSDCVDSSTESDEILRIVDDLMYSVKRIGKNSVKFSTFTGSAIK